MIRIFRRLRIQLLNDNKVSKYLIYAIGEIALVMIGILLALQVNNWNEDRKRLGEETKILQELKNSISTDIIELSKRVEYGKQDIYHANSILDHIEKGLPYSDSLNKHFIIISKAGINKIFSPEISAYKVLESKGVDLMSSDTLKKQVLDLYNIEYPKLDYEYENYRINILEYGRPVARKQFIIENNEKPMMKPVDYKALSTNIVYTNTIKVIKVNSFAINEILERLIEKCQEIKKLIDSELGK
jgi:hypothetical protein